MAGHLTSIALVTCCFLAEASPRYPQADESEAWSRPQMRRQMVTKASGVQETWEDWQEQLSEGQGQGQLLAKEFSSEGQGEGEDGGGGASRSPTPAWTVSLHPPDGSADPSTSLAPIPPDVHLGLIKDGWCSNWGEGSSVRDLGEFKSYWGPSHAITERDCFFNCDDDRACEQANYQKSTKECWLGINAMNTDPEPTKCSEHKAAGTGGTSDTTNCDAEPDFNTCYAKHGWSHTLALDVKAGWCSEFSEGWGGTGAKAGPKQCDLNSHSVLEQKECSHWGAEYGLSERGCWVKCQENTLCKQAIYENKPDSWGCFIGTNAMTVDPGPSRCTDCDNKCYAPLGFGNLVSSPTPATSPTPAASSPSPSVDAGGE